MLKVEISGAKNGRKAASCQLMGSEKEIANDIVEALGTIYTAIKEEFDPINVATFRCFLVAAVLDPSSPVWNTRPKDGEKVVFKMPEGQS